MHRGTSCRVTKLLRLRHLFLMKSLSCVPRLFLCSGSDTVWIRLCKHGCWRGSTSSLLRKVNLLTGGKVSRSHALRGHSIIAPGQEPPRCILGCIFPINRLQWLCSPSGPPDKVCQSNFFFLTQPRTRTHTHRYSHTQTRRYTNLASLIVTLERRRDSGTQLSAEVWKQECGGGWRKVENCVCLPVCTGKGECVFQQ